MVYTAQICFSYFAHLFCWIYIGVYIIFWWHNSFNISTLAYLFCCLFAAPWLSWTMVKPDIHTLAHHLKQERLYVASEKQLIQRLNNEVLKTAERLYRAAWIAKQQRINLDRLILTRWLHCSLQTSKTRRLSLLFSFMTHYLINWTGRITKITLQIISVVGGWGKSQNSFLAWQVLTSDWLA